MKKRYEHLWCGCVPGGPSFDEWIKERENDGWEVAAGSFGQFTMYGHEDSTIVLKRPVE